MPTVDAVAGPAPARLSTEATNVAAPARADGQMGESDDSNEYAQLVAEGKDLEPS